MQAGKNISASVISKEKSLLHQYKCIGGNGLRGYVKDYNTEGFYSIVGRQGALCGCLHIEKGKFYATEHAVIVDSWGIISPVFMYYILIALNLNQYSTATAQPGLSVAKIITTIFPLPPLAEQQRIVEKIEELMPLVELYGKAQSELEALNSNIREQLKKSILQYAIEGKLVPQCEEDGTAEYLLQEIQAEKQRLYAEGKLKKKDLTHSTIFRGEDNKYYEKTILTGEVKCIDDEIPFELPNGWEWCRLGDVGDWGAGATPLRSNPKFFGGHIPWLKTGELNYDVIFETEECITKKALQECSLRLCSQGDVLIAMYGATIGKLGIAGIELTTNQACCACTPILFYNMFLFYYLMASKQVFVEQGEGGAQPNISRIKLVSHLFPMPPLAEQHRIVDKIKLLFDRLK